MPDWNGKEASAILTNDSVDSPTLVSVAQLWLFDWYYKLITTVFFEIFYYEVFIGAAGGVARGGGGGGRRYAVEARSIPYV